MVEYQKYEEWMGDLTRNKKIYFYMEKEEVMLDAKNKKEQILYLIKIVFVNIFIYFLLNMYTDMNLTFFSFLSLLIFYLCLIFFVTYIAIRIACLFPLFCFSVDGIHSKGYSGRKIFISWSESIVISEEKTNNGDIFQYNIAAESAPIPDLYSFSISKETAESYKFNKVIEKYSPPGHPLRSLGKYSD